MTGRERRTKPQSRAGSSPDRRGSRSPVAAIRRHVLNLARRITANNPSSLAKMENVYGRFDRVVAKIVSKRTRRRAVSAAVTTRSPGKASPFGANVVGYLTGEFGMGEVGRAMAKAVDAAGVPRILYNLESGAHRNRDKTFTTFSDLPAYRFNLINVNAAELPRVVSERKSFFEDRYNIGIWFWELPEFPEEWFPSFNFVNEIWATSTFVAESIAPVSPVPVVRMPYPMSIADNYVRERSQLGVPESKFVFLFSFDFRGGFERKNPLAVVSAFQQAFGGRKDVHLFVKSINGGYFPDQLGRLRGALRSENTTLMEDHLSGSEMIGLLAACDSYVSLHRSEGLGLGMAKAMYLGKPVVGTGYSGNTDFMTVNNSYLAKFSLVELAEDHGVYPKGSTWAEPDIGHAAELMSTIEARREESSSVGKRAASDIRRMMGLDAAGQAVRKRLERISG